MSRVYAALRQVDNPALIKQLIELTVPIEKDRIILDPFMGSGTTAIATLDLGLTYLGFEIVPQYFLIAQERISNFKAEHRVALL